VCRSFGASASGVGDTELFDIASGEITIEEPPGLEEVTLTKCRVSWIRETKGQPLDSQSREVRFPIIKERGLSEKFLWVQISR
jgi:hypothetical protein